VESCGPLVQSENVDDDDDDDVLSMVSDVYVLISDWRETPSAQSYHIQVVKRGG